MVGGERGDHDPVPENGDSPAAAEDGVDTFRPVVDGKVRSRPRRDVLGSHIPLAGQAVVVGRDRDQELKARDTANQWVDPALLLERPAARYVSAVVGPERAAAGTFAPVGSGNAAPGWLWVRS